MKTKSLLENYLVEVCLKEDMGKAMGIIDKLVHSVGETDVAQKVAKFLSNNKFAQSLYGKPGYTVNAAAHDVSQTALVGGLMMAGILGYAAHKTYKNFFSKAAKACQGKTGTEKSQCMVNYRKSAIKLQIKDLMASSSACSKSKDPAKCKTKIKQKIDKLKLKL